MFDDCGTEAEALNDWFSGEEVSDPNSIFYIPMGVTPAQNVELAQQIGVSKTLYLKAKAASVGQPIQCPTCRRKFVKHSYQQAFCSNKGQGNCKDRYWNQATPERRERAQLFS